jgi:hypothetical protein
VDREELAALMPLLGLVRFDRRACNQVLRGLAGPPVVSSGNQRKQINANARQSLIDDSLIRDRRA